MLANVPRWRNGHKATIIWDGKIILGQWRRWHATFVVSRYLDAVLFSRIKHGTREKNAERRRGEVRQKQLDDHIPTCGFEVGGTAVYRKKSSVRKGERKDNLILRGKPAVFTTLDQIPFPWVASSAPPETLAIYAPFSHELACILSMRLLHPRYYCSPCFRLIVLLSISNAS